ncbi:MAG: hypothetical protein QOC89_1196 [Paraburkholderia sp.]|nr:hypothetical protein [Paraburkholderia sp.]
MNDAGMKAGNPRQALLAGCGLEFGAVPAALHAGEKVRRHGCTLQPYAFAAASRSAASIVLTSSMVMVIGPTPPGTGVI